MPDPIDWQARAVAAEVALITMLKELGDIAESKAEEVRNDWTSGEAHGWDMALRHVYGLTPDLTAARELIEKAGECDAYMRLYGEAMLEIAALKREGNAAVERAFCDAALGFADAKASIEAQSTDYRRALAALQAARRKHANE